jgi:hypothetical protein
MKLFAVWRHALVAVLIGWSLALAAHAQTAPQSKNYAPGFTERTAGSKLLVLPAEVELFSISAGGVQQPRADWTQAASDLIEKGLNNRSTLFGQGMGFLSDAHADDVAEVLHLHKAVVRSVFLHHMVAGPYQLPTKGGRLDWSMGDAVKPLRDKTGADYALFVWVRDSYASAERKAAIVAFALLSGGGLLQGGHQLAYSSLVDLRSGQVVWFNSLSRSSGDLREAAGAEETIETLLQRFPPLARGR